MMDILSVNIVTLLVMFLLIFLVFVTIYIYSSFAYMAIARKAKYEFPGLAWIPIVGPSLILSKTAGMHWWPVLFGIGFFIPVLNYLCIAAYMVFYTIWLWKTLELLSFPRWWAIISLISPLNLIFLGIIAWSKPSK